MSDQPVIESSSIELNDGARIPQIGFGVFQVPPETTQQVVEDALAAGYRHLDTAAAYNNEVGVGAAVRASGLHREDLFVTTKLRNGDQGHDEALRAFDDSCSRLGLDYVDLYLIHWPYPVADQYVSSWRALQRLHAEGRARSVGVSNFLAGHLDRLAAETDLTPAVNQIELHPTFQQREVAEVCRARGIAVEAYSPLGQGADLDNPAVQTIAERLGRDAGQVVLRWHLQLGHIVIPKSKTPERIRSNRAIEDFELTAADLQAITGLDANRRIGGDPNTFALTQIR